MKISVCLIMKNEEELLGAALETIPKDFEIVIADTGSIDRSIEIAKSYTEQVYSFQWINDFSAARNYCASHASGDYILAMDADERLPSNSAAVLTKFIKQNPDTAGTVCIENSMQDEIKRHRMVRFYPNRPGYSFAGTVHEQVCYNGAPASFKPIDLIISHLGYEENVYTLKSKAERYLPMYLEHLERHPEDGYMLYQLGKLYQGVDDLQNAERYLRCSMAAKQVDHLYYPVMLVLLGYVLQAQKQSTEAFQLLQQAEQHYPKFPDLPFLMGLLAMDTGNLKEIERCFKKALSIGETTFYTSVAGVGSYKAAYNLGVFYEITGNIKEARRYYQIAAKHSYEPAKTRLSIL